MADLLLGADAALLIWIQETLRTDILTPVMLFVTRTGNAGMIWIILSLALLCCRRTRKAGMAGIMGLLFSLVLNNLILKNAVGRIRPYEVIEGLVLLTEKATDFSFPSGHTGSSFACATAVSLMCRGKQGRWYLILLLYAVLMGMTRLYVGIHYPSDVLAGMLTGILCGYLAYRAVVGLSRLFHRKRNK